MFSDNGGGKKFVSLRKTTVNILHMRGVLLETLATVRDIVNLCMTLSCCVINSLI